VQALILTPTRELAVQVSQAISSFIGNQVKVLPLGGQAIDRQMFQKLAFKLWWERQDG